MRVLKEAAARAGPPRDDRGRRLRRAGRRRGDHPPRAGGRSRGRPAELSPPAGAARARRARRARRSTPSFRSRTSSIISRRRAARRRARAASSAFVTVQEGCDKFCTFCVVPYTRGAEVSRPVAKIVAEAERLADAGVREITLIGQNVNAYHGDGRRRPAVDARPAAASRSPTFRASRGCATPPAIRATWTTSLIAAHRDLPALMPQLHLPVQSGSDRILAAMNRRHTRADYLRRDRAAARGAARSRASPPISSSAFPGETEDDFARHAAAGRRGRLRQRLLVQIFAAARHAGGRDGRQVPEAVKDERLQRLQRDDRPPARPRSMARCVGQHLRRAVREGRAAIPARSSAARPICSRCRSWRRRR